MNEILLIVFGSIFTVFVIIGAWRTRILSNSVQKYLQLRRDFYHLQLSSILEYFTSLQIIGTNRIQNRITDLEKKLIVIYRVVIQNPQYGVEAIGKLIDLPIDEPSYPANDFDEGIKELTTAVKELYSNVLWFIFWFISFVAFWATAYAVRTTFASISG